MLMYNSYNKQINSCHNISVEKVPCVHGEQVFHHSSGEAFSLRAPLHLVPVNRSTPNYLCAICCDMVR